MANDTKKEVEVLDEKTKADESYYPPGSAGRVMTNKVPVALPAAKIAEVEKELVRKAQDFHTIYYIYIVDGHGKLKGALSVKEIFRQPKDRVVSEIMTTDLVTVRGHTDQEKVALTAIEHGLKAVPVVGKDSKLLGVVPPDDIITILHNEGVEDSLRSAGIHIFDQPAKAIIAAPAGLHIKKRLPWLILGLLGGVIAALVVGAYEEALETYVVLAAFMPMVVYLADAVGAQTQTLFIRSLALQQNLNLKKYIAREVKVGVGLALILSLLVAVVLGLFWQPAQIGVVVGVAIFSTVLVSTAVAMLLPWLLFKVKFDPAIASGPFATVIRDIVSLFIYFGIAGLVL